MKKGYFDLCHYNSSSLEICHYNSRIWIHAITILLLLKICHCVPIRYTRAHVQRMYRSVVSVFTKLPPRLSRLQHGPIRQILLLPPPFLVCAPRRGEARTPPLLLRISLLLLWSSVAAAPPPYLHPPPVLGPRRSSSASPYSGRRQHLLRSPSASAPPPVARSSLERLALGRLRLRAVPLLVAGLAGLRSPLLAKAATTPMDEAEAQRAASRSLA